MDATVKEYLDALYYQLSPMPEGERVDAVREIESHLAEGQSAGKTPAEILAGLGHPHSLAKAYLADYYTQQPPTTSTPATRPHFLALLTFFAGTGFASLIVVPLFGSLALGFGLAAIVTPVAGVLHQMGVPYIRMGGPGFEVPLEWSVPIGLLLGGIFGLVAWGAVAALKAYFRFVSRGYRRMLPGRAA